MLQNPKFKLQWTHPVNSNNFDLDYYEVNVSAVASSDSIHLWSVTNSLTLAAYLFDPETVNDLMSSLQSELNVSISAVSRCLQRGQTAAIIIGNGDDETTSTSMVSSYSQSSDSDFLEANNGIIIIFFKLCWWNFFHIFSCMQVLLDQVCTCHLLKVLIII